LSFSFSVSSKIEYSFFYKYIIHRPGGEHKEKHKRLAKVWKA